MATLTLIFSVVSLIMSLISFVMGMIAFIELRSFMKSTHKVEFVPANTDGSPINRDKELEDFGII